MSAPTRAYRNGSIAVEWRSELCTHCGNCLKGLPAVFDLNARPWVNLQAASAEEIVRQVGECPSGDLAIGVQ